MAALPVLSSYEIILTDDVVRDLFTPGKNFKQDLVGPKIGASGPVDMAGDRVSVEHSDAASVAIQMCSIQLEKQSETIIKLFVTVYKTLGSDQPQQTDPAAVLADTHIQTDGVSSANSLTQTDTVSSTNSLTQTSRRHLQDSIVQTDEMRLFQSFSDSSCMTNFNMSTQVDGVASAVTELGDSFSQTEVKSSDVVVQTERNERPAGIQTDPLPVRHSVVQTDALPICHSVVQTDPTPISYVEVQTNTCMANELDVQTQTSVEMSEKLSQTELVQQEMICQTDVSMAWQSCVEIQASADMIDQPMQTDLETGDDSCQTDLSFALRKDSETQSAVEVVELSSQTECDVSETSCQTSISIALQADKESQIMTEVADSTIQTDVEEVLKPTVEPAREPSDEPATISQSQDSANDSQDFANDSLCLSQDDQFTQITQKDGSPCKRCNLLIRKDGMAQTDPVTIIIGDASFLVKKLKSSAVSPSKITTSGNEIEIELSADVAASDAPFEAEEKENDAQGYTPVQEAAVPRAGPMIRGGAPALVTRPGTGGGVRVRMPTTMQSPLGRPPVPRGAPGAPVRFQSPAVVRAPVLTSSTPQRAPTRVSSGATFSCPFCNLIFIDSPALYEHLSVNHQVDQKTKWKQPKGREGKTIVPRKSTKSPEHGPPVLTPIEPLGTQPQSTQFSAQHAGTDDDGEEEAHEAGLFEDPVDTSVTRKRRGRPKTRASDIDTSVLSEDDVHTSGKRKRKDADSSNKRARMEDQWEEAEEGEDAEEEEVVVKTPRRGGRTPRSRTK